MVVDVSVRESSDDWFVMVISEEVIDCLNSDIPIMFNLWWIWFVHN